jgi:carbonic anhydrase
VIPAREALQKLEDGNRRFAAGSALLERAGESERRMELLEAQRPFAIILGCSDSRVPAEYVFDQGLGDLFVIRVAGNIVAPSQVGSIEFAAERFGVRLVVVLGHSGCGAVAAALEELARPSNAHSPNLGFIVKSIAPGIEPLVEKAADLPGDAILQLAVRENIRLSAEKLRNGSTVLERLIVDNGLVIVGAEYSLKTGVVDFFDVPG